MDFDYTKNFIDEVKGALKRPGSSGGKDGFSPTVKENPSNTDNDYRLDITDKNRTFTTPNLKGKEGKTPTITIGANNNWFVNGVDTGVKAKGEKGDTGSGFNTTRQYSSVSAMMADTDPANDSEIVVVVLGDVGNFYMRLSSYVDPDGITNGYLPIGSAQDISTIKGDPGKDGTDGITPHIDSATKHWFFGTADTGVKAEGVDGTDGTDGITPHIDSATKHWFIGDTDTGIVAEGIGPVDHANAESGIEDTPVGHIIPYMGNTAPKHYLICDGTEYNIVDYPYLAQHFIDEFGSVNYFGGDGTTTFAVPDLRGEFLRGTGVNYHANQGSGADVGVHQDATKHNTVWVSQENKIVSYYFGSGDNAHNLLWGDHDSAVGNSETAVYVKTQSPVTNTTNVGYMTARPTNTSVLYCIKYEPTYFMQYTNQYAGFHDTVLFDGDAKAVGGYTLADDITNYDYILVEISSGHSNTSFVPASYTNAGKVTRLIKVSDIHIASKPLTGSDQFVETQWFEAAKSWYYFLSYWFISSRQFYIDEIYYNNFLNPRIKKITGIKGGA